MLSNIFSVALSDALSRGFFFLFNVAVARAITPEEFGIYGLALSLGVWLWAVADVGLTGHGTRLLAQGKSMSETISMVLGSRMPVLGLLVLLFGVTLLVLPLSGHECAVYFSAILYLFGMTIFPAWIARSQHANREYIMAYAMVAGSGILALSWFWYGEMDRDGLSAILFRNSAWLIGAAIAFIFIAKHFAIRARPTWNVAMLKATAPLGAAAISYNLLPLIPFTALRIRGTPEELGIYAAMMQIQMILLAGAGVFSSVSMPTFSKVIASKHLVTEIKKHLGIVVIFSLIVSLVILLLGKDISRIIYGENHFEVDKLLHPFSLALLFATNRLSFDSALIACGKYLKMLGSGVMSVIVSVVVILNSESNSMLVSAWAYCLGEFSLFAVNCFLMVREVFCAANEK